VIDAQTGTIAFSGGDATFNAGSSFIGAGTVGINNNASFNGMFSSSNLNFNNGRFTGNGAVLTGTAYFTGGRFSGGWTIDGGDTLVGVAGGTKHLDGAAITNNGTIDWQTTDALYFESGTTFANNGLFVANADTTLLYNGGSDPVITNNAGGVLKSASGVTLTVANHLENSGTLQADGTIRYVSSNAAFNQGSIFTGAGVNRVESAAAFNGGYTSSNLELASGVFTGTNAVAHGNTSFTGGTLTGSWEIAAGQSITGNAGGNKYLNGGTLTNNGTLTWATGDALYFQSAGDLINRALIDVTASTAFVYNGGSQPNLHNTATGTIHVAAGKTLDMGTWLTNDGGTITADGTLNLNNGTATINAGTLFNGVGVTNVNSNTAFNGAFTSNNLVFNNGTFGGSAAQLNGIGTFAGGRFSGTWEVAAGQTLNAVDGGFKYLNNATFTNNGTINWNTGNALYMESDAQLRNDALINVNADTSFVYNGGSTPVIHNEASGVIHTAAGKTLTMGTFFSNDGGTITSDGTTLLSFGNTTINAGSLFNGAGTTQVTNNAVFNGGFTSSNLVFANGFFTGNAAVANGTSTFTGGNFTGDWTVGAGQTLVGADGAFKMLTGGTFTNKGSIDWNSGNALYLQSGAVLNNAGTFDIGADMAILYNGGSGPAFTNTGTIIKTGGAGTATIGNTLGFVNQGTIDVRSGTLQLPDNFTNDGTLTGSGAFQVNGTLTNAGTVAPGVGAGTLTLNGNYAQTGAGIFSAQLQSSSVADMFVVNGNASLGGTLAISCIASCAINTGDIFTILDSTGPLTGAFANVTTSGFLNGFAYDVVYDYAQNWVQLKVLDKGAAVPPMPGVPEPANWAMMIAGFGIAGAAMRRRHKMRLRFAA
jgi:hypothetical protein